MGFLTFFHESTAEPTASNVADFFADLSTVAPLVGEGCHGLPDGVGGCRGWVQFIVQSDRLVRIHRIWTLRPGEGNGSAILHLVCDAADRHEVEIELKVVPFGRKPYPNSREQLVAWYTRHGFAGTHRKMVRKPVPALVTSL